MYQKSNKRAQQASEIPDTNNEYEKSRTSALPMK